MCAHWTHISVHALWCLSFSPYHICLPCLFVGVQHRGKTVQMHTVCTTVSCCLCVCVSGERPHTSGKGSTTGLLGHSTRSLKVWTNQTESDIGRLKIWRVRRIKRLKDWKYRDCKQAGNTGLKARQFQSSQSSKVETLKVWIHFSFECLKDPELETSNAATFQMLSVRCTKVVTKAVHVWRFERLIQTESLSSRAIRGLVYMPSCVQGLCLESWNYRLLS